LQFAPGQADYPLKGLVPYQGPWPDRFPYSMEFNYLPLSALVKGPDLYGWTAFKVAMRNRGIAPFYNNGWRAELRIEQNNDAFLEITTDWTQRMIQPGELKTFSQVIDIRNRRGGEYLMKFSLPNPMSGGRPLRFANANVAPTTGSLAIAKLAVSP